MAGQSTIASVSRSASILLLCFCLALTGLGIGCGKKPVPVPEPPPPPPPPPPPALVEIAEEAYAAGNIPRALGLYEQVLADPEAEGQQTARFRLGVLRAQPGSPLYDPERARMLLRPLAVDLSAPYFQEATAVLELLQEVETAESQVERSRNDSAVTLAELEKAQGALEELRLELERVSEELRRLKAIDQERRGRRP